MPSNPKQILLIDVKACTTLRNPVETLAQRLLDELAHFQPNITQPPQPYWKLPEWHECTIEITPANRTGFNALIALVKEDWHLLVDDEGNDCEGIWNPAPGHVFLLPEVTWAQVLLVTPNPPILNE